MLTLSKYVGNEEGKPLFNLSTKAWIRNNLFKLQQGLFKLNIDNERCMTKKTNGILEVT